ncbi:Resolvase, N terminal domain [Nitrosospira sp. Nsp14]|nr:Resolvase, N terminal domain [Nitrosospira sp. Nsp14]
MHRQSIRQGYKQAPTPGGPNYARAADALLVHSMGRLAREAEDMLRLVSEMNDPSVSVEFIKEKRALSSVMTTRVLPDVHHAQRIAQFERSLPKERQREGTALAKAKGTAYKGRKPGLKHVI